MLVVLVHRHTNTTGAVQLAGLLPKLLGSEGGWNQERKLHTKLSISPNGLEGTHAVTRSDRKYLAELKGF